MRKTQDGMSRRLPPLNALRAFDAAARNGSLTRAARELLVTQGAVSRHVSQLEKWLGVALFARTRQGIEMTPQGAAYFMGLRAALDQIEHHTRLVQQAPDENTLRLKLPPTFAIRWLVPRLARFHAANRHIDVQITTSHQPAAFDRGDIDACIFNGPSPLSGFKCRRLFGEILLPVCSPRLFRDSTVLSKPEDLAQHVLLCSMHRPDDWPTWLAAAGLSTIDGNDGLKFENSALAYQAAIDELGVVMAQRAFVDEDLRTGRLVAPLSLRVATESSYYLAYPAVRPSAKIEAFEEWIMAQAAEMVEAVSS